VKVEGRKLAKSKTALDFKKGKDIIKDIRKAKYLYLLLLPGIIYYIVFHYFPMGGVIIAFKEYKANLGILGSPWIGLKNYSFVFKDPAFFNALKNTLVISVQRLIFQFPFPVIIALFFNEIRDGVYKRVLQTVFTFPHFLSWVIVAGILVNFMSFNGALNNIAELLGFERKSFLSDVNLFRPMLYITENWKNAGWQSIIYLAAITSISQEQYEAAEIDGCSRFKKMIFVTIPNIQNTIIILFILAVGRIMNAGFEQIFNMQNPAVKDISDILDTYIYRITFMGPADFSFSTAIGLFKSIINFILITATDRIAKGFGEEGLF